MKPLAIIIPTKNELGSIPPLVREIDIEMSHRPWVAVLVDSSTDGTADEIEALAAMDNRVRLVRQKSTGLAGALSEGLAAAPRAQFIAVMDADGQHDPRYLPDLTHHVRSGQRDIAIASRISSTGAPSRARMVDTAAIGLVRNALDTTVLDPLSRYFVVRRSLLEAGLAAPMPANLAAPLIPLLAANPTAHAIELPILLRPRARGRSKMGIATTVATLTAIARITLDARRKAA